MVPGLTDVNTNLQNIARALQVIGTAIGNTGAVLSVTGSGGTTGLTLTGGPGGAVALTLGGTLAVANGGIGATSFAAAGLLTTTALPSTTQLYGGTGTIGAASAVVIGPGLVENSGTLTTTGQQPYVYRSFFPGSYTSGQTLDIGKLGLATTFPANLAGSFIGCLTAPTGNVTVSIEKNGTVEATGTISASGTVGSFGTLSAFSYGTADVFSVIAPGTSDASLAGLYLTMVGTR
jgi:hypothetical protein